MTPNGNHTEWAPSILSTDRVVERLRLCWSALHGISFQHSKVLL